MEQFTFDESPTLAEYRIVAVGVGGSGSNIVNYMLNEKSLGIELIIANTDEQDNYDGLRRTFERADIVFVVGGLGGRAGIDSATLIAKIAKEVGALTIGIVSKPFHFEGYSRLRIAKQGLEMLKSECDSVVIIANDMIPNIDVNHPLNEGFKIIDGIFARVINGISGVIVANGENDINLDIVDLQTIMSHQGIALAGVGESQGEKAAYEAIISAVEFAKNDNLSIKDASGVLVHFTMHPDFHFMKLSEAMDFIHNSINESADVIFGTTTDENLPIDFIRVTLIATGCEKIAMLAANNVY